MRARTPTATTPPSSSGSAQSATWLIRRSDHHRTASFFANEPLTDVGICVTVETLPCKMSDGTGGDVVRCGECGKLKSNLVASTQPVGSQVAHRRSRRQRLESRKVPDHDPGASLVCCMHGALLFAKNKNVQHRVLNKAFT
jgi:hypothetical protein